MGSAAPEELKSWGEHCALWSVCGGVCVFVRVVCGVYVCGVCVVECVCVVWGVCGV